MLAGCEPKAAWYESIQVRPDTLEVRFAGELREDEALDRPHYFRTRSARGRYGVTHYLAWRMPRPRIDALQLDEDSRIFYRTRYRQIAQGDFGALTAVSQTRYDEELVDFYVSGHLVGEFEPAETVERIPESSVLDAVSIARLVRRDDELLLAAATYPPNGKAALFSLGHSVSYRVRADSLARYGLPPTAPARLDDWQPDPTGLPSELAVVSFHYDRGRFVQQRLFHTSLPIERTLRFREAPHEAVLAERDAALPFGVWAYRASDGTP